MLFSSYDFLFLFLPAAVIGFYALGRLAGAMAAFFWLLLCSFFFYGWWSPAFLLLLIVSCTINAALGLFLTTAKASREVRYAVAALGIAFNLGTLIYFKYANFVVANVEAATGVHFDLGTIILPLGISFFMFQKIAFLADAYSNEVEAFSVRRFLLFVFFFPQLIAGPIVHHREIMPQMDKRLGTRVDWPSVAMGLTIFVVGLFKKTVIADGIAPYATSAVRRRRERNQRAVRRSLVRHARLHLPALFRFFRLFRHGDRACAVVWAEAADQLRFALQGREPDRLLAPLAHHTVPLPARLSVHSARRRAHRHATASCNVLIVMMLGGFWHGAGWTFCSGARCTGLG